MRILHGPVKCDLLGQYLTNMGVLEPDCPVPGIGVRLAVPLGEPARLDFG